MRIILKYFTYIEGGHKNQILAYNSIFLNVMFSRAVLYTIYIKESDQSYVKNTNH